MQLTQFDRWLRERFIYRTHIYTMRLPEAGVPSQVLVEELEDSPTRRYRYRLIVNAKRDVENLLAVHHRSRQPAQQNEAPDRRAQTKTIVGVFTFHRDLSFQLHEVKG